MLDVHVDFFEAAGIEQHGQPLACRQPPLGVLRLDPLLAPAQPRLRALGLKLFYGGRHILSRRRSRCHD
jgi:hypothetical protein